MPSCSLVLRSRCFSRENVDLRRSATKPFTIAVSQPVPPASPLYQSSGTRKVGSGYPTDSTCLYLGLRDQYFEFVHGSTATGSVPLILAFGVRPSGVWGSVLHGRSHISTPLLTLMLRVLRCLSQLARTRARAESPLMRRRAEQAWRFRWGALLSCSAARAVAMSLLAWQVARGADGTRPQAHEGGPCLFVRGSAQ